MPKSKKSRKARDSVVNLVKYNSEKRSHNLLKEVMKAEAKYLKLLDRNKRGLLRTPGKKITWDDAHKEPVKVFEVPRKQGFAEGSKRAEILLTHIKSLKEMLNK